MKLQFFTSNLGPLDADHVLGGFRVGAAPPAASNEWPVQHLSTPLLGASVDGLSEIWGVSDAAPLHHGSTEGIAWRRCGDLLFGVIALDEVQMTPPPSRSALQHASELAYARIFRLLDAQALPHLWRLWNYMADINGKGAVDGLERYRQFNRGRAEAFEGAARSVVGRVPAACALGVAGGPLTVAFLAGATPVIPIENPRQISAFLYPSDYGPRPPTFARAALARQPGQEILFVSGTASIVGHQSLHPGNVRAQTVESLDNIAAVLAAASTHTHGGGFALHELAYRAYIRHADDVSVVQEVLAQRLGAAPVVCVQADICRADLLVEIEGQCVR